jgi:hypothetical protein
VVDLRHYILILKAQVHMLKSEYTAASNIHTELVEDMASDKDSYLHAVALNNRAHIYLEIDRPVDDVQKDISASRTIFHEIGRTSSLLWCDVLQARLKLKAGDILGARKMFQDSLTMSWGKEPQTVASCLEALGKTDNWTVPSLSSSWTTDNWTVPSPSSNWTIVFLVYSSLSKKSLGIYKGLQFLGDSVLREGDSGTAMKLFHVALEGFARMGVHRSSGECLLQLGDIAEEQNLRSRAIALWNAARPLFE